MIPKKDIPGIIHATENPNEDPVPDYPSQPQPGVEAWRCRQCGELNSQWDAVCLTCAKIKRSLAQDLIDPVDLAKLAGAADEVFRKFKFEPFSPFTVNRYEIEKAINWIDLADPQQAKVILLQAIGAPVPVLQPPGDNMPETPIEILERIAEWANAQDNFQIRNGIRKVIGMLKPKNQHEGADEYNQVWKHDGGTVFPTALSTLSRGMSLRDYFAGQAISALIREKPLGDPGMVAHWAYAQADAMLVERRNPSSGAANRKL